MLLKSAVCLCALAVTHSFCYTEPSPVLPDWIASTILALMSAYLAVGMERAFRYAIAGLDSDRLKREVAEAVRLNGIEEALVVCAQHRRNLLAVVIRTALSEIKRAASIDQRELERVREGFSRVFSVEIASLKRDITLLKTIGQTAVLIGFTAAIFDIWAPIKLLPMEGDYPASPVYGATAGAKFAITGMLISIIASWTHRFICFRIESAAAQSDQSFLELAGLYAQHRAAVEAVERIQSTGLEIWD